MKSHARAISLIFIGNSFGETIALSRLTFGMMPKGAVPVGTDALPIITSGMLR